MGKRIITTENLEEDIKIEGELRPQSLGEYIGQEKAKETLGIYIEAAKARGRPFSDHNINGKIFHSRIKNLFYLSV